MSLPNSEDRGASLIGYALMVMLIAVVGFVGIQYVGQGTSNAFMAAGNGLGGTLEEEAELTPEEKWAKAQEDYANSIQAAKDQKAYDLAAAKADYDQAVETNKSLPKAERQAANQTAKDLHNGAKGAANETYQSAVAKAKADRDAAKSAYQASKKKK